MLHAMLFKISVTTPLKDRLLIPKMARHRGTQIILAKLTKPRHFLRNTLVFINALKRSKSS